MWKLCSWGNHQGLDDRNLAEHLVRHGLFYTGDDG